MEVEWQPDEDNVCLSSKGYDNLVLHRKQPGLDVSGGQKLDHLGIIMKTANDVYDWYEFLKRYGERMLTTEIASRWRNQFLLCQSGW